MNLSRFSVQRPVFTLMTTLIVVLLGLVSLWRIQVDLLPEIELPVISVRTEYAGASPEVMERTVTQIVEEIIATVPGVEEVSSVSSEGKSEIRVVFGWGTDIDSAALEVRSHLEDELDELPESVTRPSIRIFDIGSFPVVLLGVSSQLDPVQLTEIIENQLRYRFTRIPDVAQVDMWGGFEREVRIELFGDRIMALSLGLDEILTAIRDANLDLPAGQIERGRYEITLRAPAEFTSIRQLEQVVIALRDGAPVTLGQVAEVKDTYRRLSEVVRVNGDPGVRLAIRKESTANTVDVAERILAEVEAVNADFPQLQVVPVLNQGNFIERSIRNVARSVLYGGLLAVMLLLFFLLDLRSTAVVSIAIPISVIATLAVIFFSGLTINLMSLGGFALGIGMMVDSSIVVLENIFRRRDELGESAGEAAVEGASEVATAIIASTATTLVVFLPLAFVQGVSGLLFRDFAYVVVASLGCSLVVSLSLLPMIASRLLNAPSTLKNPRLLYCVDVANRVSTRLEVSYRAVLRGALARRFLIIASSVVLFVVSLFLYPYIGSDFLPPSDEGQVSVSGEMEIGTRLNIVDRQTRRIESIVYDAVPEMQSSMVTAGTSGGRSSDAEGRIDLNIGPAVGRGRSNSEVADDLRERLKGEIPGMKIRVRAPQGQFILNWLLGGETGLTVEVRGFDFEILESLADQAVQAARAVEGVTDVRVSRAEGVPQEQIRVNRAKIADLGLSVRDVSQALQTAVAGSQAGDYRADGNAYRILVQLADITDIPIEDVLRLTLTSKDGEQVALANLVDNEIGEGPLLIERKDQQRIIEIDANVSGRDLGSVATELAERLDAIPKPTGYELVLGGAFEEQERSSRELLVALALALVLVYMVLASQFESLKSPWVVMLSVPMAVFGVLLTLFATNTTLNIQSYIGCIMLGGIVVNNAILLVDQAERLVGEGTRTFDAVMEAGRRRLRPILMTTLTTILGLMPLALGIGEGADAQAPLARAVIGGLLGSTPVTLVLIPVVYTLMRRDPSPPLAVAEERSA